MRKKRHNTKCIDTSLEIVSLSPESETFSASSVLRSFDVKKFRLTILGEKKKFWRRKSNLHIGGLVVRLLFLANAARVRFPVKATLKKSSDFSKCAICGA